MDSLVESEPSTTTRNSLSTIASEDTSEPSSLANGDEGNYLLNVNRRAHFLRAAAVGLAAGAVAVAFQLALDASESGRIGLLTFLRQFPSWGWSVLPFITALCGAAAGYITERYAPAAAGSGIPHIRAVLAGKRRLDWR